MFKRFCDFCDTEIKKEFYYFNVIEDSKGQRALGIVPKMICEGCKNSLDDWIKTRVSVVDEPEQDLPEPEDPSDETIEEPVESSEENDDTINNE